MAINWQRPEYEKALPEWELIDTVADERNLGTLLPMLNEHDKSRENITRNRFYRDRASWFGATAMTLAGLVGIAFEDAPEIELPSDLEYLRDSADGAGLDLDQQMQKVMDSVLRKGRTGLFVTYPHSEGDTSVADAEAGNMAATIHVIDAKRIVNWWTEQRGAKSVLAGVVFTDSIEEVEDYEIKETPIMRELALEDGGLVDRRWHQEKGSGKWVVRDTSYPLNKSRQRWKEIPFVFIGATDNSPWPDRPPMLSLARKNRDYYRNSADHEESVWYAGQAQPYLEPNEYTDLDDIKTAEKDGFYIGSRQLILGKIGFAQASPETGARQAMLDKLEEMKALGARFLQPGGVAKTATEAGGDQKVQHSILSLISVNVEAGYNAALRFVSEYMNAQEALVTLSRDFMQPETTPEMIDRLIALIDRGYVGAADAMPILKRARFLDSEKEEDEYIEEVANNGGMIGMGNEADGETA